MSIADRVQVGLAVGGAMGSIAITLLWRLVLNIAELNRNIAVIVSRVDTHEKRLDRLEDVIVP